ncbi:MAG: stalk domain-containing protein [Peptococcaceae bacterium]|nr:stalk domain-containing protein [Peptococcaceae bacterium]
MKRIATLLLLVVFTMSLGAAAFAENGNDGAPPPVSKNGVIVQESDGFLEVRSEDGASVRLNMAVGPYVVDCVSGDTVLLADRTNDRVVAYYGPVETRSMPPQSNPILIIVNVPESGIPPHYATAEKVDKDSTAVKVTVDNGSTIVTLNKDTELLCYIDDCVVSLEDIVVGTELLLWYPIVALSHPAQATAQKALFFVQVAITEDPEIPNAPEVTETPEPAKPKFTLSAQDALSEDGVTFVPLRTVSEAMGFSVTWNGAARAVTIAQGTVSCTIVIGANEFNCGYLENPPVIVNDKTYVPIYFFEELKIADYTNEGGNIIFTAI